MYDIFIILPFHAFNVKTGNVTHKKDTECPHLFHNFRAMILVLCDKKSSDGWIDVPMFQV